MNKKIAMDMAIISAEVCAFPLDSDVAVDDSALEVMVVETVDILVVDGSAMMIPSRSNRGRRGGGEKNSMI